MTSSQAAEVQLARSVAAEERRRVVVAMSGGVDSSVVAALLRRQGHEVIGITLQLYDHGEATGRRGSCCAGQDIHDARRVAETLGIPHYVLDYESRFERSVMRSFADSYINGETPIPCVTCNQQIKFRELLDTAKDLNADVLATGHYIQRRDGPSGPELYRAVNADRDQSYFLFAMTREQLAVLRFPLGTIRKAEVRALANKWRLPVAEKPDSQDICFVPAGRYTQVIERLKPGAVEPGDIIHVDGRVLGHHKGIVHYTVGQRRGLNVACGEALYVVALDAARRLVVVGPRDRLRTEMLLLRDVNWLGENPLAGSGPREIEIYARIRSTQAPFPAVVCCIPHAAGSIRVVLPRGEYGVAAGQACVFYSDGTQEARVLGGGWIARTQQAVDTAPCGDKAMSADMRLTA
jgi:tRNA-uridine 2-sulfurtransferase